MKLKSYSLIMFFWLIAGNAMIFGIDIVLALILPAAAINFFLVKNPSLPKMTLTNYAYITLIAMISVIIYFVTIRIGVDYFDGYSLWPLKCFLLILALTFGPKFSWDSQNQAVILMFCLLILSFSSYENGRLESFFGPNMLYRIFGLLAIFPLLDQGESSRRPFTRLVSKISILLGVLGMLATGSTGGLIVVGWVVVIYLQSLKPIMITLLVTATVVMAAYYFENLQNIESIHRLIFKLGTYSDSLRFVGWEYIAENYSFWGHDYYFYLRIWDPRHTYPHNIVAELVAYYGFLGLSIGALLLYTFIKAIYSGTHISNLYIITFIGACVSGDLSDNYICISIAVWALLFGGFQQSKSAIKIEGCPSNGRNRRDFNNNTGL